MIETDNEDFRECVLNLIAEYVESNVGAMHEEDFDERLNAEVVAMIQAQFGPTAAESVQDMFSGSCAAASQDRAENEIHVLHDEEALLDYVHHLKRDYFRISAIPPREYSCTFTAEYPDYAAITEQLDVLRSIPQPAQRSPEWYEQRNNMITASDIHKVFGSAAVRNSLIFSKCQHQSGSGGSAGSGGNVGGGSGDEEDGSGMVAQQQQQEPERCILETTNLNSTLHWGQKYEPLSVKIYEYMFKTKIELFGCIPHSDYYFIGASPDGINVDPASARYGRLLEIKNIVNREISGCPKKEYWVQMQMQMEVCGLDECDFLETKFTEYGSYREFLDDDVDMIHPTVYVQDYETHCDDTEFFSDEDDVDDEENDITTDEDKKADGGRKRTIKLPVTKGAALLFVTPKNELRYEYMPLYVQAENAREWAEQTKAMFVSCCGYRYVSISFWRLDVFSCVLVRRNPFWFEEALPEIEKMWNTIASEKVTGCEHRAPMRRTRPIVQIGGNREVGGDGAKPKCLLKVVKREN